MSIRQLGYLCTRQPITIESLYKILPFIQKYEISICISLVQIVEKYVNERKEMLDWENELDDAISNSKSKLQIEIIDDELVLMPKEVSKTQVSENIGSSESIMSLIPQYLKKVLRKNC